MAGLVLLVGALFIYSSFIQPTYSEIQELRGERAAKESLLNDYKSTAEALNNLLQQYKDIAEIQDTLSESLPLGEHAPEVFNQLQGIATSNNLRIDSVSFQYLPIDYGEKNSILRPLGTLRISMKMAGTYDNLKTFLEAIETNIRILDVVTLSLEGGAIARNPALNYNLIVDTYYQAEK